MVMTVVCKVENWAKGRKTLIIAHGVRNPDLRDHSLWRKQLGFYWSTVSTIWWQRD